MTQTTGHGVVLGAYGPPEVLVWSKVPKLALKPTEVRIRTLFAPVNHTDLKIRAGIWPIRGARPFPYTPGVEAVGVVDEAGSAVGAWTPGQTVITMMQGLGGVRAERPGAYAEFVTVDADAVAAVPGEVDAAEMAAVGLAGVTAYHGLKKLGPLSGQRVLVTGAAGGVGSAAVGVARALGASVTGLVGRAEQGPYVRALGADTVVVSPKDGWPPLEPASIDGVFDTVGGRVFSAAVDALRPGGTLSLVGAAGGGEVTFDAWRLISPVTLTGYSTENLDGDGLREAIAALSRWLAGGMLHAPKRSMMPLSEAAQAHRLLEAGGIEGRVLLTPEEPAHG
jgi:NADPH2:quinone reductase